MGGQSMIHGPKLFILDKFLDYSKGSGEEEIFFKDKK